MRNWRIIIAIVLLISILVTPAYAYEELAKGSKGEAVVELQEDLNAIGYPVGKADGDFGGKTESAIKLFQKEHGIAETGIADASTMELIEKEADIIDSLDSIYAIQCYEYWPIPSSGAKMVNVLIGASAIPGGVELFTFEQASEKLPLKLTSESCPYGWLAINNGGEVKLIYRAKDADGISISNASFDSVGCSYMAAILEAFDQNGIEECGTYVNMDEREAHYWQPPRGMTGLGMNGYSSLSDFCEMLKTI